MRFFKYSAADTENNTQRIASNDSGKDSKGFSSFFAKLVCVAAAIIVWFYVSGEQSITFEKEFPDVEIKYNMGALGEKGYKIVNGKNTTVDVTVTGTRREVNDITTDKIAATADLSHINTAGEYSVKINVSTPGNTNVKDIYPYELKLYIDTPIQKSFKVDVSVHNLAMGDSSLKIRNYKLSVNEVWVSGPEEEVNKIAGAKIDLDFSGDRITDSVSRTGVTIKLVDHDGNIYTSPYLTLDESETNVDVIVNKYMTVPIKPKYSGGFDADSAGYSENIEPSEISIKGAPEIISGITYIETAEIDADDIYGEAYEKEVTLSYPSGVEPDGSMPENIVVTLERTNGKRTVTTANIVLINKSEKLDYSVDAENVSVVFSGNLEDIEKLNEKNVYMIADMVGINSEGKHNGIKLRPYVFGMNVLNDGSVKVEGVYNCTVTAAKKKTLAEETTAPNTEKSEK